MTLHWWYVPIVLLVLGSALARFGVERYWTAFGWPDTRLNVFGYAGWLLILASVFITIGGALAA